MLSPEIVEVKYCIPLTETQWKILDNPCIAYDFIIDMERETRAEKIDWSGHFGMNIFFSLDNTTPEETQANADSSDSMLPAAVGLEKVKDFLEKRLGYI